MDLVYSIKRSPNRKRLTITVERDREVIVHAPERLSDEKIEEVVQAKRHWIYEKLNHPQKYQTRPHPPGKELVGGESVLYLGQEYRIELVQSDLSDVWFDHHFKIPESLKKCGKRFLRSWYLEKANELIPPRVQAFAKALGVEYGVVKITDNRFRWGSCTPKSNVHLNWRLIKAPMFVVDYVIIHELAHLLEPNHTPEFWNIVQSRCPRAKNAKAWLRDHGGLLEEDF